MSALAEAVRRPGAAPRPRAASRARLALLGTGNVGSAVLERLAGWAGTPFGEKLELVYAANTRRAFLPSPVGVSGGFELRSGEPANVLAHAGARAGVRVGDEGSAELSSDDTPRLLRTLTPTHAPASAQCAEALDAAQTSGLQAQRLAPEGEGLSGIAAVLGETGTRIVIDATASAEVASRHAGWLAQGIHVVTACKLARGTALADWQAIEDACAIGGSRYGEAATVGAGLPLLRSIRELRTGGDRITAIAGVLSGSLAWLFDHYDGLRPFSGFVREARAAGYTEPDPREDLSGEDVRRKLLILARAAGVRLEQDEVAVDSLVPEALATLSKDAVDGVLPQLDPALRERYAVACKNGEKLRFIARLDVETGAARVGLESLPDDHPLAGGAGTDNKVAIWSDRYCEQPLVIQGPGAGAEVTAAGLLDDVLRIACD